MVILLVAPTKGNLHVFLWKEVGQNGVEVRMAFVD